MEAPKSSAVPCLCTGLANQNSSKTLAISLRYLSFVSITWSQKETEKGPRTLIQYHEDNHATEQESPQSDGHHEIMRLLRLRQVFFQ